MKRCIERICFYLGEGMGDFFERIMSKIMHDVVEVISRPIQGNMLTKGIVKFNFLPVIFLVHFF